MERNRYAKGHKFDASFIVCEASIRREDGRVEPIELYRHALDKFVLGYRAATTGRGTK